MTVRHRPPSVHHTLVSVTGRTGDPRPKALESHSSDVNPSDDRINDTFAVSNQRRRK
jgi:hypothetical protein